MEKNDMMLLELIDGELEKIAECKELTRDCIEALDKLTHAKKSILTSAAMTGGESYDDRSYRGSYGTDGGSYDYDGGSSGRRSRNRIGQFSRNGSRSYDGGMSGNSDMREVLENLHRNASDPKTRRAIEKAMAEMG